MEKLRAAFLVSFSTKVLVPVIGVMMLLMGITAWTLNQRLTQQFQTEARQSLDTADKVFRNSQRLRTKNLVLRFRNLPNEPRYRAAFQSGHVPTLRDQIKDLPAEQGVDIALFAAANGEVLASSKRDPLIPLSEFETNSGVAIKQALRGEEEVDTIRAGSRLFDLVSIPVFGPSEDLLGALTFGSEIGDAVAQEFSMVTHSQIVLLANGRVIASTVGTTELQEEFAKIFTQFARGGRTQGPGSLQKILIRDEHYFCSGGRFSSLNGDSDLGYLLLSSYEQPLQALHSTQQTLLLVSILCILAGSGIVWFLVRKVTQPLRELRDSAEAVGQGDFSRRVEVGSTDECGELAHVFNQMTENLKLSREQLEQTVETLKSTQAQLIQSEKLSGIGQFVAGVAHELNNPLTSVMGFSEMLARSDKDPQNRRHLELIHKSALRCQKIVQSLLSFARRHQPERKLSNLNTLVENTVDFLQYQLRTSNIEVVTRLDSHLPSTMVDPHQLQQVLLNILNNARQAIEGFRPDGRVVIITELQGGNLRIIFQDNGPGISEENLSKIFDPFFTTKEVGKGTGLGLSLCYGIIREHGGVIQVRSKPGEGATFIIELPLVASAEESGSQTESTFAGTPPSREGVGKKVLVIDDEESILEMVRAALSESGYEVDVAKDGESGLRQMGQTRYDLTLCDWKMPGLNGQQIYERVRALSPEMSERMVFITGDVINGTTQKFLQDRKKVCLSKPFSLVEFRAAVGKAMAR
jgi:signal transduction histidine kinase/CheY-like chemotaxis protein